MNLLGRIEQINSLIVSGKTQTRIDCHGKICVNADVKLKEGAVAKKTILKRCNPNRHGTIKLVKWADEGFSEEVIYTVHDGPSDEDGAEYEDLAEAEKAYERLVSHYADLPNWEAQAEYDAVWGEPLEFPRY
jgi:hypothetical protein